MRSIFLLILFVLSGLSVRAGAADATPGLEYFLPTATADYDPAVPTPEQALGWRFGEWHLHHHELVSYLQRLAELSDRIEIEEYARSHGRRPLLYLKITAPANHTRLEEIRKAHVARVESPQTAEIPDNAPGIVWMGYGIHGNEPSASQAAVLLAYHLAAARDAATRELLERTVILLDPCLNPDGFERFAAWTNSHRGLRPSGHRADREHQESWPNGRSNYYWFDLNRDWLPAVHPESQGRLRLFHDWLPNIVTDYHEMGNNNRTYFFQPGIPTMVHPQVPEQNQVFTRKMAEEHARALDAIGSLYYSGESFDDFYVGKGSTYPDFHGSVGILFEQAGTRGHHQDTEHGRLTFAFTIRNHVATSLSSLRSAVALRPDLLAFQRDFYRDVRAEAAASKVQAHIFTAPGDPARLQAFQELLGRHRIQSHRPAKDVEVDGRRFPASESLVVPLQQRQFRLLQVMFEKRTEFASSNFYDVSAWHMPSAYGLVGAELPQVPAAAKEAGIVSAGALAGADPAYAYVFSWESRLAPRALFRLLEAKVRCWAATRRFTTGGDAAQSWPHGSIVVPVGVQESLSATELRSLMQDIAREDGLRVQALATGYHGGVPDLGSPSFRPVRLEGVLLVTGPGVSSTLAGDVWYQFDQVWQTPLVMAEAMQISESLLTGFSSVILAGASFSSLPEGARQALKGWVERGGNLIALGSATGSLAAQEWCKVDLAKASADVVAKDRPIQHVLPYDQASERRTARELNGVIVEAVFDPTHPLAWGLGDRPHIQLMRDGTTFLKPASSSYLNPLQYTDKPLVAGSASRANLAALRGTTPLQVRVVGRGRVILFTDNPVFRGHWLGTEKLLANALFFGSWVSSSGGGIGGE
jgi:hypothetical protein